MRSNILTKPLNESEDFFYTKERFKQFLSTSLQGLLCFKLKKPMPLTLPVIEQLEWIIDNAELEECNQVFADYIGFKSPEEAAALPFTSFPNYVFDLAKKHVLYFIESNYKIDKKQVEIKNKKGTKYYLQTVEGYIEKGFLIRIFASQIDITPQIKAEQAREELLKAAQQSEKLTSLGHLASAIAHDFNNVLTPILGSAQILLDAVSRDNKNYEDVRIIHKSVEHARELVNQILSFAIEGRGTELEPLRLEEVLEESIDLAVSGLLRKKKKIILKQRLAALSGKVNLNKTQISRVVMNLITNSVQALKNHKGKLTVELSEITVSDMELIISKVNQLKNDSLYAKLSISDNGCGIKPDALSKVFEPYFTTKSKDKGSGIGMATVYNIIKEHSGEIKIMSKVGKGTTVDIYLPLIPSSKPTS